MPNFRCQICPHFSMSMPTYVMLILYTVIRALAFQQILEELRDVVAVPIKLIFIRSLNEGRIHAE
jgi:hypothetical protein